MPSNVFANTGTNVSVLFFDKSATTDKVILIDASKLGEEYKDANGLKKVRLNDDEIEKIVGTFQRKEAVEDFSVAVSYDEIKEKGYSLSAGQYFDIKIDYVDITYGNIYEITPFENTLCIVTMNGSLLRELFENIAAVHGEGLSGACLEISGDGKLLDATVAGKEIEDSKEYKVATLDYLAEGNDHMTAFAANSGFGSVMEIGSTRLWVSLV